MFVGRVLLAEDNPVNQKVALLFLRRLGVVPDVAADGAAALARARAEPYDLVLMDRDMPELDGLEVTRALRAEAVRVPICALTAGTDPDEREACRDAGMDDFLAKPIEPAALAQVLSRWLRTAHP